MAYLGDALPGAAAALSAEDSAYSAELVNALKNKLHTLAGQHTDVLETFTPNVRKCVEALREIQGAAGAGVRYLGYSPGLFIVGLFGILILWMYGNFWIIGILFIVEGDVRGCDWKNIGDFVNMGSYYLVGIPSAVLLSFVLHMGGKELWVGLICALVVQVSLLLIIIMGINWEQEVKQS